MKRIFIAALAAAILLSFCGCHIHRSEVKVSCTEDEICTKCLQVMKEAPGHSPIADATCTEDSVCGVCGEVVKEAFGHDLPNISDCTVAKVCTVCGVTVIEAKEHTPGAEATCTEPQLCTKCGVILTEALGHAPDREPSCTDISACTRCGEVLKEALGHTPGAEPTETQAQTCTLCNAVLKPATGPFGPNFVEETVNTGHYNNNVKAYYSGNVLICGDYAVEYFGASASGNSEYAQIVSDFAKKFPALSVKSLIVPKAATFHSPEGYTDQQNNHKAFIDATYAMMDESVVKVDAFSEMAAHEGEYMFYRTDHHWTSLGAYYASVAYCKANGITPRERSSYESAITAGYVGSLYTYGGKPAALTEHKDYNVGRLPAVKYTMTYTTDGATYKGSAVNKNGKGYASMFMCGDQAFTHIVTENKNGRKLIIFKESYGNAFAPYMIDYYEEVIVIDIRKSTESVAKIISDYGITDALIINNIQAVSSLRKTLKEKLES